MTMRNKKNISKNNYNNIESDISGVTAAKKLDQGTSSIFFVFTRKSVQN